MRKMPPLTWFRAFEAAARCQSFTGAAAELGLTQSAISQHVRSLEHRFGVSLFRRQARGIVLTDEGRKLLPEVSRAIDALASVSMAFDTKPSGHVLTIAASISIIQWYVAPGMAAFSQQFPDIAVRIINTTWPDEFHASIADVEIRFGSGALVGKGAQRLLPDTMAVVGAPTVPVTWQSVAELPLIEPVGTSDGWASWAKQVSFTPELRPSLFVDSHGLAVDLARRGAGIALTSSLIALPSLRDGSLVALDGASPQMTDGYYLALNTPTAPGAAAFCDWLHRQIGHAVP